MCEESLVGLIADLFEAGHALAKDPFISDSRVNAEVPSNRTMIFRSWEI